MTTPTPYQLGEAAGLLYKSAGDSTVSYSLTGTLYVTPKNWVMLSVPNALVRGAFDALHEPGAELPYNDDGRLNAHCSVMRPDEVETIGGADRITERGKQFRFTLGPLKEVKPDGWAGVSKVWFISLRSPDLERLRRSYGLSSLPNDNKYEFHATVARRKVNVLRDNEVVKQSAYGPPYRCETCTKKFAEFPDGIDKCTACSGDLIPEQTFREKWPDRDVKSAGALAGLLAAGRQFKLADLLSGGPLTLTPPGDEDPELETPEEKKKKKKGLSPWLVGGALGAAALGGGALGIGALRPRADVADVATSSAPEGIPDVSQSPVVQDAGQRLQPAQLSQSNLEFDPQIDPTAGVGILASRAAGLTDGSVMGVEQTPYGRTATNAAVGSTAQTGSGRTSLPGARLVSGLVTDGLHNEFDKRDISPLGFELGRRLRGGYIGGEFSDHLDNRGVVTPDSLDRVKTYGPFDRYHQVPPTLWNTLRQDPTSLLRTIRPYDIEKDIARDWSNGTHGAIKGGALISIPELDPAHPDYPTHAGPPLGGVSSASCHEPHDAARSGRADASGDGRPSAGGGGPAYVKGAAGETLAALLLAQQHSDHRDYKAKHRILSQLLRQSPQDFTVDQPHPAHPGLTHLPTGFRMHAPFSLAALATGAPKAAASNPVLSSYVDRRPGGQDLDRIDAHVDGKNVGYLTSHPGAEGDHRWLEGMEVDPQFRRQGLARVLLGDAVGRYGDQELRLRARPYGDTPVSAERLQSLYSQFGFSPYDDEGRMARPPAVTGKTAGTLRDLFGCQSTGTDYQSPPKEANAMSQQERVRLLLPTPTGHLMELFDNPKYPDNLGQFRFPGGGVEPGETYEQAAVREAREELGVDLTGKAMRYVGADHRPEYAHEHYLAVDDHGVSPGSFADQANPGSKVTLFDGRPEGEKYIGPDVTKLISKAAKKDRPVPADWNAPADRESCPGCGAMHERGDGFCNSCGERWPAVTEKAK